MKKKVFITGIGIISPLGNSIDKFETSLKEGKNGISRIEQFDATDYRSPYGGEIKNMDPNGHFSEETFSKIDRASQMVLLATIEAIENSRLNPEKIDKARVGIALGSTQGGILNGLKYYFGYLKESGDTSFLTDYPLYSPGRRVRMKYGFTGPNIVTSTACSAGNMAIGYGIDIICAGKADVMIVGGYDPLSQLTCAGFGVMRNMTQGDIVQPFDKNRGGLLLGEGAGITVIESQEHCEARGGKAIAELLGYGASSDAYHMTAPDNTGIGPALAMSRALEDGNIEPSQINYINAHGTATHYNDQIETRSIKKVFGDVASSTPVSSIKSMMGHSLGACGGIELVASVLAIRKSFLPPTINYVTPDPKCDLDYIPNKARLNVEVNYILSNNFGFGGNNCSILIGKHND